MVFIHKEIAERMDGQVVQTILTSLTSSLLQTIVECVNEVEIFSSVGIRRVASYFSNILTFGRLM